MNLALQIPELSVERIEAIANEVHVHKFGGSSLADAFCFRRVARIVTEHAGSSDLVIVSAAGDTTNRILALIQAKDNKDLDTAQVLLDALREFQQGLINELLTGSPLDNAFTLSQKDFSRLEMWLQDQEAISEAELCAYGELWSARLLACLLQRQGTRADYIDARHFLVADDAAEPIIHLEASREALLKRIGPFPGSRFIITGFIAAEIETGRTLLLGRNGSDYSATLIASLINSKQTIIWKDVAGVYSADPRRVERVVSLPSLDWAEAEELARLGSPILHPRTFQPINRQRMVISVRSSLKVENQQTRIGQYDYTESQGKVLTSSNDVSLFCVSLHAHALLKAFQQVDIQPLLSWIEEGHTYFAFHDNVVDYVRQWFAEHGASNQVQELSGFSMIALVGARIQESYQYATLKRELEEQALRYFSVAGNQTSAIGILNQHLDQGLLNRVHSKLFKFRRSVGVVLFGCGNIGSAWLELFKKQKERTTRAVDVHVIGIASSTNVWLDYRGVDLHAWDTEFQRLSRPYVLSELLQELPNAPFDELVALDLTDSESMAQHYTSFFANGFHMISANKRAGASTHTRYKEIRTIQQEYERQWLYNTTVGAGLPINYAIRDLKRSGDTVRSISGIFSGTLCWLFEHFDKGDKKFSELVRVARAEGYTEPDPRDDLSCTDIARKLLIVARDIGAHLDWDELEVESLVPEHLIDIPLDEFLGRLEELDEPMEQLWAKARKDGKVPRLIASFTAEGKSGQARVGVDFIPEKDMLANLIPAENIFVVYSDWYHDMPLVISGPGAGKQVTAGGVQSDLHQLLSVLGSQEVAY